MPDKENYIFSGYEDIKNNKSKFVVQCKKCGYIWKVNPNGFFNRETRCSNCNRGERWSLEKFLNKIELLSDKDDYIFSDYEDINSADSKFTVQCKKCDYVWQANLNNFFQQGYRCSFCNIGQRWTFERITKEFALMQDSSSFTLILDDIVEIKNAFSKIKIQCHKCNHIWKVDLSNFFHGNKRCPRCKASKGEKIIEFFLQKKRIKFESEKKFDTCRNIKPLPFDFYLQDYNLLIEFQGIQHYQITRFSKDTDKNQKRLEECQKRDTIKKQFAIDNGYRFLEISYREINQIEEILTQELCI